MLAPYLTRPPRLTISRLLAVDCSESGPAMGNSINRNSSKLCDGLECHIRFGSGLAGDRHQSRCGDSTAQDACPGYSWANTGVTLPGPPQRSWGLLEVEDLSSVSKLRETVCIRLGL